VQPSPSPSPSSQQYRSTSKTQARKPITGAVRGAAILQTAAAVASLTGLSLSLSAGVAQATVDPLSPSNYSVRAACGEPAAGHAGCLALQLVPRTGVARAHTRPLSMSAPAAIRPASAAAGAYGLRPVDLHAAYALPTEARAPQTVAIVDAYDDPNIEADLATYDREFGLPPCDATNGCFAKINQSGQSAPLPQADGEWSLEISLDVELARATCQSCRILLVEAESNSYTALEAAENAAVRAGATEISNSWGGPEPVSDSAAFNHPGVVITAAAGDTGYLGWDGWEASERGFANYPASSPHVVAVGGTHLLLGEHGEWKGESVWNDGDGATGGGCSSRFLAAPWQAVLPNWSSVGCGNHRAVADVAAVADPYTGAAVYDSMPWDGFLFDWVTVGGTSLSSPVIASTFALAGGVRSTSGYAAQTLYENAPVVPGSLHDVTSGSSGACHKPLNAEGLAGCTPGEAAESCAGASICLAGTGYDGPTGVGSPDGLRAFQGNAQFAAASGVGGQQGGAGTGGGSSAAATNGAGAGSPPVAVPPSHVAAGSSGAQAVRLSGLRLSPRSRRGGGRHDAEGALVFTSTGASPVRLTIARLRSPTRRSFGRAALDGRPVVSFKITARKGRNAWPLRRLGGLRLGRYRLTLTPAAGAAHSLEIEVR
jgi:hypothetical protein